MGLEAIQKVTDTEREAKRRKEAVLAENKQKILVAQRAAQRLLEETRIQTEREARQMMVQAENEAAEGAKVVMEQARQESEAMKQAARQRLSEAAELIVEKVVNR